MSDEHSEYAEDTDAPQEPTRRDFLRVAWGASAWLAAGASGFVGLRFLSSRQVESDFGKVLRVGRVDDFEPGTVTPINNGRFFLVRAEDGGFLALYRKCTHLDCVVIWQEDQSRFYCPCHGSVFEEDGAVVNPPAPLPLMRFPIIIDERGRIDVDTGSLIERRHVSPDDYTYPPETAT